MVNSFEFQAKIRQGMIEIPQEYPQNIQEGRDVKVILVSEEKDKPRLMEQLAEKPIRIQGGVKPSRDEIHERKS